MAYGTALELVTALNMLSDEDIRDTNWWDATVGECPLYHEDATLFVDRNNTSSTVILTDGNVIAFDECLDSWGLVNPWSDEPSIFQAIKPRIEEELERIGVDFDSLGPANSIAFNYTSNTGLVFGDDHYEEEMSIFEFIERIQKIPMDAGFEGFWEAFY